jgi:hypothetical protein
MANVQWAKVGVEGIVQESVVDGKVNGRVNFGALGSGGQRRLGRPLCGRLLLSRVGKRRVSRWRRSVCGQKESICSACQYSDSYYLRIEWQWFVWVLLLC